MEGDAAKLRVKKITRAEESARIAYRRALEKSVRAQAKGTGWKSVSGSIFREQADWFIEASLSVYIYECVTSAVISVKPMAIDPIFWDIVGLPENREQPLSFRAIGAWACRPPYFFEASVEEDGDIAVVARRLIAIANEQLEIVLRSHSLDAFLLACRGSAGTEEQYLPSLITTLVAMQRQDEALAICLEAQSHGSLGGFLAPEGSFVEMATTYLQRSLRDSTRH
jgi:hypothetical protein